MHETAGILYGKGADATRTKQALKQDVGWFGVRSERRRRTEYNSVYGIRVNIPAVNNFFTDSHAEIM